MNSRAIVCALSAGVVLNFIAPSVQSAPFMIVGDDEKASFVDGKTVVSPPGKEGAVTSHGVVENSQGSPATATSPQIGWCTVAIMSFSMTC